MQLSKELELDLRRTLLLGAYMRAWGMPLERNVSRKGEQAVEVYAFPALGDSKVNRYATVGLSGLAREDGQPVDFELLLAVLADNGGATAGDVTSFLMDVVAYALRREVRLHEGSTVPESPLAPKAWAARALLIDEPRAEPEELAEIAVGPQRVKLWWLVPIHGAEQALIVSKGLAAFDAAQEASEWSLADPGRPSVA